MAYQARSVKYYNLTVKDQPGEAYNLLTFLESMGINLQAFHAVPIGPARTQLTLFPDNELRLISESKKSGLQLEGPHPAILVQGDDELGALSKLHMKLYHANVNVFSCSGVADGKGDFGYVIYVRPEDMERAIEVLDM